MGAEPSTPSKSCGRLVDSPGTTTKLGSSPATVIAPRPKCGPINVGLIRTLRPI